MGTFASLPPEIIVCILRILSVKDALACAATCHQVRSIISFSAELQLVIELAIEGFQLTTDWRSSGTEVRSARQTLVEFQIAQNRWKRLEYTNKIGVCDEALLSPSPGELVDGVWGYEAELENGEQYFGFSKPSNPGWAQTEKGSGFIHRRDMPLHYYTWDETQDLLVLFGRASFFWNETVHVKSLLTNMSHPLAKLPVLNLQGESDKRIIDVQLFGPLLFIQWTVVVERSIDVYNWNTGDLIFTKENIKGFAILTDGLILILPSIRDSVRYAGQPLRLDVYKIWQGTRILSLFLPFSKMVYRIELKRDSFHTPTSNDNDMVPYIYNPGNDWVIILTAWYRRNSPIHVDNVVISVKHILHHVQSSGSDIKVLDWSSWGPAATRWFQGPFKTISIYRSRILVVRKDDRSEFSLMLDFNQRAVSHRQSRAETEVKEATSDSTTSSNWFEEESVRRIGEHLVTEEWVIRTPAVVAELRSRLPFRAFSHGNQIKFQADMRLSTYLGAHEIIADIDGSTQALLF